MEFKAENDRIMPKGRGFLVPPSNERVTKNDEKPKQVPCIGRGRGAMLMSVVSGTRRTDSLPSYLFR